MARIDCAGLVWLVVGLCMSLSGCARFGFDSSARQVSTDSQTPDSSQPDLGLADSGTDGPFDQMTDRALVDSGSSSDSAPDLVADGSDVDASVDELCAVGATVNQVYDSSASTRMVTCVRGATENDLNQCAAEQLCAPGAVLCTASMFRARGGQTIAANRLAWLASCIRSNGAVLAFPSDEVCPRCDPGTAPVLSISMPCGGGPGVPSTSLNEGMQAGSLCFSINGVSAFWFVEDTSTMLGAAMCCDP